jgi:diguanylate cyclase (GGDEF)-like protein
MLRKHSTALSRITEEPSWRLMLRLGALYFLAILLFSKVELGGDGWQIFWPLNGITIALLIGRPRRDWLIMLAAIEIGTAIGDHYTYNIALGSEITERFLSMFEVTLSAWLLPQFTTLDDWLRKPGLYARFAAAVIIGPAASGLFAAVHYHLADGLDYVTAFNNWAFADALGIGAMLPLAIAFRSPETRALFGPPRLAFSLATLAAALGIMAAIFGVSHYPLIFILYPLLMLVDYLLGFSGSMIALCCACLLAVYFTEHGYGPFANTSNLAMSRDFAVQLYLGFHLLGFLPISILFLERRRLHQELKAVLAQTVALASTDALTGVANRRTLDQRLDEQWRQALRHQTSLALLMIDVDHFKQYNDEFGHQAGDGCLRSIATTLGKHACRAGDLVARFGGEEFVVMLPYAKAEEAKTLAEILRTAVFELVIPHSAGVSGRVTVSIGCAAMMPREDQSFQQLLEQADEMLYLAKRVGRNWVCSGGDLLAEKQASRNVAS